MANDIFILPQLNLRKTKTQFYPMLAEWPWASHSTRNTWLLYGKLGLGTPRVQPWPSIRVRSSMCDPGQALRVPICRSYYYSNCVNLFGGCTTAHSSCLETLWVCLPAVRASVSHRACSHMLKINSTSVLQNLLGPILCHFHFFITECPFVPVAMYYEREDFGKTEVITGPKTLLQQRKVKLRSQTNET